MSTDTSILHTFIFSVMPDLDKEICSACPTSSIMLVKGMVCQSNCVLPTVINSINLPDNVFKRLVSSTIIPAYSRRSLSSTVRLMRSKSPKPKIEVRGVFISCAKFAMKVFLSSATLSKSLILCSIASATSFILRDN